jgi:hypothetical protein
VSVKNLLGERNILKNLRIRIVITSIIFILLISSIGFAQSTSNMKEVIPIDKSSSVGDIPPSDILQPNNIIEIIEKIDLNALQEQAAQKLVALNLLKGYDDGSLGLERFIRRVEFCTIVTRMLGYEDSPILPPLFPFGDVKPDFWGYNYIGTAYSLKIVAGYPDGSFKVNNHITYAEAVTMLVRTLGYADDVKGTKWPDNFMEVGKRLGITRNLQIDYDKPVTRGEIAIMVNNSLGIDLKQDN